MHYTLDRSQPGELRAAIRLDAGEVDAALAEYGTDARVMLADRAAADVLAAERISSPGHPMYEGGDLQPGREYDFTARFSLLPTLAPFDCSSMEVSMPEPVLGEGELRGIFLGILRRNGTIAEITDGSPAAQGDIAVVDIDAAADGNDVPGMTARDLRLRLDEESGPRLAAVRALVTGLRAGETADGAMPCPMDFPDEALRGKSIGLRVTLKSLLRETLPALDDAFAAKLGFDSLKDLEKKALDDALAARSVQIRAHAAEELLSLILRTQDFPLPEPMRVFYVRSALGEAGQQLLRQGVPQERIPARLEALRADLEGRAARNARVHCLLLAVARDRNITVPEEETDKVLQGMAGPQGNVAELRFAMEKNGGLKDIRERLLAVRAMDSLFEGARKVPAAQDAPKA